MKKDQKYLIALDAGTTSVRTLIFNENLEKISISQKEQIFYYPKTNWVEQDPDEIYAAQLSTLVQSIQQKNIEISNIVGIGIANQRESVIVWDKYTGIPVYNAILWQDRRTYKECEILKKNTKLVSLIRKKTGLVINVYFSATKLKWILDNVKEVRKKAEKGQLLFGTLDTWLIWKLTEGKVHATDYTNASRTLLFNIKTLCWDKELLKLFKIPEIMLPEVKNSADNFGKIEHKLFSQIPILTSIGDQQAALFGQRCKPGQLKGTFGTGAFLMLNTGKEIINSKNGLLTTIALGLDNQIKYALEGTIYNAGSALKWLKDKLHLIHEYEQIDYYLKLKNNTNTLVVAPYFNGVGAPYWNTEVKGVIHGITFNTNRSDIIKATANSIVLQTKDIFIVFEKEYGKKIEKMFVDGGVTKSYEILQLQADLLNLKVIKPVEIEITAIGTALLVGLKAKLWKNEKELDKFLKIEKIYKPCISEVKRKIIYKHWTQTIQIFLTAKNKPNS